jgi:hypothetical protein
MGSPEDLLALQQQAATLNIHTVAASKRQVKTLAKEMVQFQTDLLESVRQMKA